MKENPLHRKLRETSMGVIELKQNDKFLNIRQLVLSFIGSSYFLILVIYYFLVTTVSALLPKLNCCQETLESKTKPLFTRTNIFGLQLFFMLKRKGKKQ